MFSLQSTKYTYIKQMKPEDVRSLEPIAFTAPFIFTDFSFSFDGARKDEFDEEWKNFLEDWEVSDMRITHGRAQAAVESPAVAAAISEKFVELFPPNSLEQVTAEHNLPCLLATARPSMYAMVKGQADCKFELYSQACVRLVSSGSRDMVAAAGADIAAFLAIHLQSTGGNTSSRSIRSAEQ